MSTPTEGDLDRIVRNLIERYHPQCIILFGSMARGGGGEWSDIDLCVIKQTDRPFFQRIVEARTIADGETPLDLLVYTPDEWRQMREEGNYFIRDEILATGKVLYGDPG